MKRVFYNLFGVILDGKLQTELYHSERDADTEFGGVDGGWEIIKVRVCEVAKDKKAWTEKLTRAELYYLYTLRDFRKGYQSQGSDLLRDQLQELKALEARAELHEQELDIL